ncbi:4Fe-4S binding protein [Williamwhitmania taraxaci]|nr:4Fe-4S binding protein [Williamwhitmania taraxaci]
MNKKIVGKVVRISLLVLVIVVIAIQQRKTIDPVIKEDSKKDTSVSSYFSLGDVQRLFDAAAMLKVGEADSSITFVYDSHRELLGQVVCSGPYADSIIGYSGPTPLLIGISNCDTIVGINLLRNTESPGYIRRLEGKDFFKRWNGLSVKDALASNVDAIAGATYSSDAIIQNMRIRLSKYAAVVPEHLPNDWNSFAKLIASFLVLALALLSFFFTIRMKRFRMSLLVSSILVLGFWGGTFISSALLYGWLVNGIPWFSKILLSLLFLLTVALPLLTNKSFYCSFVCPFGACQELAGKISPTKIAINQKVSKILRWIPIIFLGTIALVLLLGISVDLTNVEPFSAFTYQTASAVVLVLAIFFLLVSIFVPKPWCNYFCPTGALLELIRKPGKPLNGYFKRKK